MPILPLIVAALVAVVFAVLMLVQRTLYASAVCFLVVLSQVAGLFYLMGMPLLAFLQIIIYAGAIMVLVVTAIMASPARLEGLWSRISLPPPLVALALVLPFFELSIFAGLGRLSFFPPSFPPWPALAADFAAALFGPYALLTEAAGLLIFMAALAVVEIGRTEP